MPITVKQIILWRTEVDNKPGALASTWNRLRKRALTSRSSWAISTLPPKERR